MASETFGVREFVNLCIVLLHFYLRHKEDIDAAVEPGITSALDTLVANINALQDLNPPGPI